MAGLRVTAFLFRFEIEDMALYNVGIPLDFDLLAALGVQGLPVAILGEKQANLIAGAAIGVRGLQVPQIQSSIGCCPEIAPQPKCYVLSAHGLKYPS